jgi:hypothetical protein
MTGRQKSEREREIDERLEVLFGDPPGPYDELLADMEGRLAALLHPIALNTADIGREIRRTGIFIVLLLAAIAVELWFGLGLSWDMLTR